MAKPSKHKITRSNDLNIIRVDSIKDSVSNFEEYTIETRKERCYISPFDVIFKTRLQPYFLCLSMGTIESKARNYALLLLLLNPHLYSNGLG